MCNLYSLNKKQEAVARFFRVSHNRSAAYEPASAIFPRHVAPVVRESADGEREIVTMSWGFMLLQKERAPGRSRTCVATRSQGSFWNSSFRRLPRTGILVCEPNGDVKPFTGVVFDQRGGAAARSSHFRIWRRYRGPVKKTDPASTTRRTHF
jgi:putative SOS response-associated peptidase YedK